MSQSSFLSLPTELHNLILSHLTKASSLHAVSQTCRYLSVLVAPYLFISAVKSKNSIALRWATSVNNTELMTRLLYAGVNVSAIDNCLDQTALQIALETGHTEALKVLLDHSSTVTAQLPKDDYLRSPATRGHLRMLEMLLEHIPRDQQLLNGGLLVWDWMASVAVSAGNVETVQFFLDQGLPFSDPLHDAAHRGRPEVARLLVEGVKQLDISARSEKWNDITAMDLAAKYGNVNMIEQLLDYGAEVDCVAEDGMQPIHHAAECGEADAVVCLVQKGADVDAKSDYGLTPIHLATCEDNYSALEALIAMGGDVNATDNDGHAALYYTTKAFDLEQPFRTLRYNVAGSRGVDLAWLLLRNGADPEHKDCIGWTAMDAAVRSGRIGLARTLLMARTIEGIENVPDTLEALYNCLVDMERDDDWLN